MLDELIEIANAFKPVEPQIGRIVCQNLPAILKALGIEDAALTPHPRGYELHGVLFEESAFLPPRGYVCFDYTGKVVQIGFLEEEMDEPSSETGEWHEG